MNRKTLLFVGIVVALIVLIPIGWWLASPLFLNTQVDEAFPFELPTTAEIDQMAEADKIALLDDVMDKVNDPAVMDTMSDEEKAAVEERVQALSVAMPDKAMDDAMPTPETDAGDTAEEWVVAAEGAFQDADSFHKGSGQARIFQQGDTRVLRFEDFTVTNGPDLHVLLVENIGGTTSSELGEYVDLGALKGNIGNQNYEIPTDLDLSRYSGVMIYCQPFHVVFATAAFGG